MPQVLFCVTLVAVPSTCRYYSAVPPPPNPAIDNALLHTTIRMPIYKQILAEILTSTLTSLKTVMQT
ncbi:uncharacterized protein HD556DRAFT_1443720 [Suillus plorans]|uniref:Secreted protein n=1 Tax=Suillus plorans TaxID=116603 RepID=A0A9P7AQX3_9AGAM|nr:uncharacterized protein HD556DRAFT_1443720 [Suillus plorans]KAG1793295.1 hypothetical protein HD556DRAFT_1443720 [Suillus plorans]